MICCLKMVVLVVDAPSSSHTVYFDKPLVAPRFASLILCTLYNSWHNLKSPGTTAFKNDRSGIVVRIWSLVTTHPILWQESFGFEDRVLARYYPPSDGFSIDKTENADSLRINQELADLLGTKDKEITIISVLRLNTPSTYFIYCDLL